LILAFLVPHPVLDFKFVPYPLTQTLDCILLLSHVTSNHMVFFFQGKNQQAVLSKDAEVQTEQAAEQSDFSSDSPWTNSSTFPPEPPGALHTLLHVEAASLLGMMSLSWL
jgi:hypothetical protein